MILRHPDNTSAAAAAAAVAVEAVVVAVAVVERNTQTDMNPAQIELEKLSVELEVDSQTVKDPWKVVDSYTVHPYSLYYYTASENLHTLTKAPNTLYSQIPMTDSSVLSSYKESESVLEDSFHFHYTGNPQRAWVLKD